MYLLELFDIACVLFEQFFGSSLLAGSQSLKMVQVRPGLVDLLTETLTKSDSESRRNCADSHESDRISKSRQLSNPEKLQKMPFLQGFF